eukprot:13760111-Heterocapsa_arctica.AAC.1
MPARGRSLSASVWMDSCSSWLFAVSSHKARMCIASIDASQAATALSATSSALPSGRGARDSWGSGLSTRLSS